jgi:hypothetical protein
MGILDQGIDWSAVEVDGGMTDNNPVPPGEYTVEAIKYEEKTSKAGNVFLAFEFKILGPSHANMRLWENFVITGSSNVGKARLKSFVSSAGGDVNQVLGSALVNSVMNTPVNVVTDIEQSKNPEYPDPKARIKRFLPAKVAQAQPAQPVAQPAVQTSNWSA